MQGLANLTASVAPAVLHAVLHTEKRLESALAPALEAHRELGRREQRLVARCLAAVLRWWGWIEPLRLVQVEDQLLLAWLLDSSEVHPVCRIWARRTGRDEDRLVAVGDAPNWTARAEGLKRWAQGRPVNADPWLLFPAWLRDQLPVPPGEGPLKARRLALLQALQSRPPLWIGIRGGREKALWAELREGEVKPWIHRRLTSAAKLDPDTDLSAFPSYRKGELVIQDLASQALGTVCDPDPGERWWDVCGGPGLHALHLAVLMGGKGTVITTFEQESRRHGAALRLRRSPFRNIATKLWDRRHPPGKPGSFEGVLVDAPSSGVGTWRRHPDVRWTVAKDQLPRFAKGQQELLNDAATGVRPGGTLVYSVATLTLRETVEVVTAFLTAHPEFHLDPFPHPLEESTTSGILQLMPHQHDAEVRFIARIVRTPSS
jgi:16S rRNA (cytosine967-C5)-methyltransferase